MTDETAALRNLHTQLIDACEGYGEGLDLTDDPAIVAIFRDLRDLHRGGAEALSVEIERRGVAPDDDGSFMATVHKTILHIRSVLTGLDANILPGVLDGEERITE